MRTENYRRFIFDFDGVIADSNFVKEEAITEASKIIKQSDKREEFLNFFINNNGLTREFKTQKFFDKAISNQILDKYSKLLQKTFYRCPLIPGVSRYIEKIFQSDLELVILTGGNEDEVQKYLANVGLLNKFKRVLGGPESKEENFNSMPKENETIFFGDSKVDYDLAKDFNLDFVFVYGASSMKRWKTELHFPHNFSYIKDFGEI